MRNLRTLLMIGAGIVAVTAGSAFARDMMHEMTVRLPDGSVEQIRYIGDTPPTIRLDNPAHRVRVPVADDLFSADPFAELERISAEMDSQAAQMMQVFDRIGPPMAAPGALPGLLNVDMGKLPPGVQGYSVYSVTSGGKTCSQSIRYMSDGHGAPKVEKASSGACDSIAPAAAPRTVRLAPAAPASPAAPALPNGRSGDIIQASARTPRHRRPACCAVSERFCLAFPRSTGACSAEPSPGPGIVTPASTPEESIMTKSLLSKRLMVASAALFVSTSAFAQSTVIVTEPAPPPPGAVVVREAPAEVRTYVMKQQVPSVAYEGDVLVGRVLPQNVETHVIDGYGNYAYTIVNERRVVVDPQTREVIQVLD